MINVITVLKIPTKIINLCINHDKIPRELFNFYKFLIRINSKEEMFGDGCASFGEGGWWRENKLAAYHHFTL